MVKAEYKTDNEGLQAVLGRIGKALLFAVLFTVVVFAVLSILLTTTGISEAIIPAAVMLTMVISVIIAGFLMTRRTKNKGFLKGAACGLLYVVILYFVAALVGSGFTFNSYVLIMLAVGVIAGAIGGILGVNSGGKRR